SIEAGYYIYPLREAGVFLATVADGVVDWTTSAGRIIDNVQQEGKHVQLLDHSRNVTRGQIKAVENAGWIGSIPYAYRLEGPKYHKKLVMDDAAKASIVQRIFREYLVGKSMM